MRLILTPFGGGGQSVLAPVISLCLVVWLVRRWVCVGGALCSRGVIPARLVSPVSCVGERGRERARGRGGEGEGGVTAPLLTLPTWASPRRVRNAASGQLLGMYLWVCVCVSSTAPRL